MIQATQAHLDWLTGRWGGLDERAQHIAEEHSTLADARLEAELVVGLMKAASGEYAAAEETLRAVAGERQQREEIAYMMEPAAALVRLRLAAGCVEEALQATELPVTLIARKGIWLWGTDLVPVRTSALIAAGQTAQAADLVTAFSSGLSGRDAPALKAAPVRSWPRAVASSAVPPP